MTGSVHELTLDNGMRAFLVERRGVPLVASMLWYTVGSRDERSGETGLSHFLEHMMFKGTDRYAKGEIDLVTAKLGGRNNAFTSNDATAYYFALASDRWHEALAIERSRMRDCLLDEVEFAAEKNVVLEELAMGLDDPWSMLYQTAETLAFQVHPYHHPVIGWREDVERVDADAMRAYYRRHYGPNRACLIAVGDLDAAETERRIGDLFGDLPACAAPREPALAEPPLRGERRATVRYPGNVVRLALACRTCRMGEDDDFVLDVISHVLAGSKNGRLHRRLVLDEQVATSVSTYNDTRLDPGLFWILAELREGVDPARAEALLREELDLFLAEGPRAGELGRARAQLVSSFLFEEETALDLAMRIGRFETATTAGHRLVEEVEARYRAVRAAACRATARRYFGADSWVTVWSLPESAPAAKTPRKRATRKAKAGRSAKGRGR